MVVNPEQSLASRAGDERYRLGGIERAPTSEAAAPHDTRTHLFEVLLSGRHVSMSLTVTRRPPSK